MKKIKSINQLREEKQHLLQRQAELEKAIKYDWRDVRESLHPLNKAYSFFHDAGKKSENEPSFIADSMSAVVSNYAEKLTGEFEKRINQWLKPVHTSKK